MGRAEDILMLRVLIAVHSRELKTALFVALAGVKEVRIVATAGSTAELLTFSRTFRPDAIVLEWELPGAPMVDLLPQLSQSWSCSRVLVIRRPSSEGLPSGTVPESDFFDDPQELIETLAALASR